MLMHIFGRGGEAAVRDTLRAEGKTPGDPADLWTMSRVLMVAGELQARLLRGHHELAYCELPIKLLVGYVGVTVS